MIRKLFLKFLYFSYAAHCLRWIRQKNKLTVLLYHDSSFESFEKHLKFLSAFYHFVDLNQVKKFLDNKTKLPDYSLLITFDDGHKNNFSLLTLFQKYNVKPVIFLTTHLLNTDEPYWWTCISNTSDLKYYKSIPNQERLQRMSENQSISVNQRQALNDEEIIKMMPYVDFESHTATHPILTQCTDEEILYELSECRKKLENKYGISSNSIAYPNGNQDARVIEAAKQCGFRYGFSLIPGYNSPDTEQMLIRRFSATDNSEIYELFVKVTGLFWFLKRFYYALRIR